MPRIITGKYKGRNIENIKGDTARPISGMIKEALFSKLGSKVEGADFLDVFAGTGSVGIEALSRGAKRVVFIEKDPAMASRLEKNMEITDPEDDYNVVRADFFNYDFRDFIEGSPDIIFAGPPYEENLSNRILAHCRRECHNSQTLLIIQHFQGEKAKHPDYKKTDSRKYGITRLDFFVGID
ncbi:MAG: 16S rRNA (guanine(966)-N(2))-methyltransferase RsmD [Elusimicrobiota bacterium]|nr:16S rRNA (guanine(966)-N(2))-methyltransferase RsmD [Elusimicrobiota bacterium]